MSNIINFYTFIALCCLIGIPYGIKTLWETTDKIIFALFLALFWFVCLIPVVFLFERLLHMGA